MSLMRSFTTRRKQPEADPNTPKFNGRAATQRGGRPVQRTLISAPVALVSTTNMLSFSAPDIAGTQPIEHRGDSSSASSSEDDGSDNSLHSHETDPTDISSGESSPICADSDCNHLSQYFNVGVESAPKPARSPSIASRSVNLDDSPSPALPRRAPSHSKRAHEALSRKLSVQRARSPSAQASSTRTRASVDMFNSRSTAFVEAPKEGLAQLDAVAEEFGALPEHNDDDALYLQNRGLAHVSAADYLSEIDPLVTAYLDDSTPCIPDFSGWI